MSGNLSTSRRSSFWTKLAAFGLSLLVSAAVLEIGCRLIWMRLESGWSERMAQPTFFYRRSENPVLGYELSPSFELKGDERFLRIGAGGFRVTEGAPAQAQRTTALLGDSVVFGSGHRQGATPADFLQRRRSGTAGSPERVVNLGVPGYSFAEIREFFESKSAGLKLDWVVLVVNLNDFARRDSVYEGGDNGLYRMFVVPRWRSLFFLRKSAYRLLRASSYSSGKAVSSGWYRWLFEANREFGFAQIERMSSFAKRRGIRFGVILFPSGQAYGPSGAYELQDIHSEIATMLSRLEIPYNDAEDAFRRNHAKLIDNSDHPTETGNQKLADLAATIIQ